jgi:hypothetical protein
VSSPEPSASLPPEAQATASAPHGDSHFDDIVVFPHLRQAMRTWVREAVVALSSGSEPEVTQDLRRWQRDTDGEFRDAEREVRLWSRTAVAETQQLPSWRVVLDAFQQDDRLRAQVDTLVGTWNSRRRFEIAAAGRVVLPRPDEAADLEGAFVRRYKELDAFLAAEEFESVEVWPLPGISSSELPITLEPDLELDWMSDSELAAALDTELIPRTFGYAKLPVLTPAESKQACMRYHIRSPKVVGDQELPDTELQQREQSLTEIQETLGQTLALLFPDPVAIAGRMSLQVDPMLRGGVGYRPLVLTQSERFRRLELNASMAADLFKTWGQMRGAGQHKAIALASRRLSYQASRERIEDELVDILVAAEALYLSDVGHEELGFRLALRAAALSDPSKLGMTRRDVFDTMKNAYKVRSKIVHGDVPKMADLKVKGVQVSLTDFVQAIEDIVRQALRAAVDRNANPTSTWPPNWDALTLPS